MKADLCIYYAYVQVSISSSMRQQNYNKLLLSFFFMITQIWAVSYQNHSARIIDFSEQH